MVPFVDESKIVEIIDHHKLRLDLPEYITYEIEEIGAAATLVADRFRKTTYQFQEIPQYFYIME